MYDNLYFQQGKFFSYVSPITHLDLIQEQLLRFPKMMCCSHPEMNFKEQCS